MLARSTSPEQIFSIKNGDSFETGEAKVKRLVTAANKLLERAHPEDERTKAIVEKIDVAKRKMELDMFEFARLQHFFKTHAPDRLGQERELLNQNKKVSLRRQMWEELFKQYNLNSSQNGKDGVDDLMQVYNHRKSDYSNKFNVRDWGIFMKNQLKEFQEHYTS